jgi:hypothetical protein
LHRNGGAGQGISLWLAIDNPSVTSLTNIKNSSMLSVIVFRLLASAEFLLLGLLYLFQSIFFPLLVPLVIKRFCLDFLGQLSESLMSCN